MSWRRFVRRGRWDAERAEELAAYLRQETDDNVARGMTPQAARAAAQRRLGNATRIREEIYEMNSLTLLDALWQDLRWAVGTLRRSPMFAAVAIGSLGIGIGANTAIFELIDAVRLRTLPVAHPETLVELVVDSHGKGRTGDFSSTDPRMTNPLWERIRDGAPILGDPFAWSGATFDLSTGGESHAVQGLWVSGGLFSALAVKPALGRLLEPADDTRGCGAAAAVLSDGFWRQAYGADRAVLGRTLHLDGIPVTIVGVSDAGFFGLDVGRRFDVAVPICLEARVHASVSRLDNRKSWWLSVMGHLGAGQTLTTLQTALAARSPALFAATLPLYSPTDAASYRAFTLLPLPAGAGVSDLRREYAQPLWVLLSIAGLVLFIACANLASLLLARATVRGREMAIRLAIGASRARVLRQVLVENLVLAAAGAAMGIPLAGLLSGLLVRVLSTADAPVFVSLGLDWRILAFAGGATVLTCLLFGVAPAVRLTRADPTSAMRVGGRSATAGREAIGVRRTLVVLQVALSLVLVVGALLFARTLRNLAHADPGFKTDHVMTADLDFRSATIPPDRRAAAAMALLDRIRRIPGIEAASDVSIVPLTENSSNNIVVIEGARQSSPTWTDEVDPDFFTVLRLPLVAGRLFARDDGQSVSTEAVVNVLFGRTYFSVAQPIGRTFRFEAAPGDANPELTIVGVVPDTKYDDLRNDIVPLVFLPARRRADLPAMTVLFRAPGPAPTAAITRAALDLSPTARVQFRVVDDQVQASLLRERLMATLSGGFGILGGLLAAVGLYGLLSYLVARRRVEIGIRIALGADRLTVVGTLVREALGLALLGVLLGTVAAQYAARSVSTLFFGVTPGDPIVLAVAAVGLTLVAALATAAPARRAARVEPTVALRED